MSHSVSSARLPSAATDSAQVLAALAVVLGTPLLTRLRPAWLCRVLSLAIRRAGERSRVDEAVVTRVNRAIALAARFQHQTCLTRGVSRFIVLRRAGVPVDLVFGVGPEGRSYAGHCWLELHDAPYLEPVDPRGIFPEIMRVPTAAGLG